MKPLAIDLFCGLGGWTLGLLEEGWDCIGFDIERHVYGEHRYPGQLVIQDVRTLHGSQFKTADLIVASPPCQAYSYRAMPWSRAKALPPPDNTLFDACFRIQREACEAAGSHIPLIVENVRGAQKWVGRARWNFGSFYLWGDVPALMPPIARAKAPGCGGKVNGEWSGFANEGWRDHHTKTINHQNIRAGHPYTKHLTNPVEVVKQHGSGAAWWDKALDEQRKEATAIKNGGDWFSSGDNCSAQRRAGSKSSARKFASAMIAKIPEALALHIARVFYP
jgi:C-5 cytosine-specific DNA methylase